MFASKTPRDLNPHGVIMTGAGTPPLCSCGWQGRRLDGPILADHIAEFDHVQSNEPNPILVAFREYAEEHGMDAAEQANLAGAWLQAPGYYERRLVTARMLKPALRRHGHAVLARLANLAQTEEPEPTSDEEREYDVHLDQQFWGDR